MYQVGARAVLEVRPERRRTMNRALRPRLLPLAQSLLLFVAVGAALDREALGATQAWLVKDINPSRVVASALKDTSRFVEAGGVVFFVADDGIHGEALWRSDGAAGAVLVKSFLGAPDHLTNVNGTLFFVATAGDTGRELWRSDGTPEGTVLVRDITPGDPSSTISNLAGANGMLFFVVQTSATGSELWRSDGTPAGTMLVRDLVPGPGSSSPTLLTDVNGTLFFTASTPATGGELWRSDGTEAGTVLVADIIAGSGSSFPFNLTHSRGVLFFTRFYLAESDSSPGQFGWKRELWRSDGTPAGTVRTSALPNRPSPIMSCSLI
jgi:ELWxxDGT repeat protein